MLKLYNSLSRKKEEFEPYDSEIVRMYSCGFTVYDHTHIGHVKKYVGDDIIRRTLTYLGYEVKYIQNVTDVGHLVSDADEGEDKLEKGARKYGLEVIEVARRFEDEFYTALDQANVLRPDVIQRAADEKSIQEQIRLVKLLLDKEYAYITDQAIYFDVRKLPDYNPFSNQPLEERLVGSRADVVVDENKRNSVDFALWVFKRGTHANHAMAWDTEWGEGFPGWHIECSAISMMNLGEQIDIHTGGIDHLEVHHPNEIAQNYAITGHQVVKYWVHHAFLIVDGRKMSKSLENYYSVTDVIEKGFDPIAIRLFVLGTHYRKTINFTWEGIEATQIALDKIRSHVEDWQQSNVKTGSIIDSYQDRFVSALEDDFNTPKAIAIVWDLIKSDFSVADKYQTLMSFDQVLGLNLADITHESEGRKDIPDEINQLAEKRASLREANQYEEADEIRRQIEKRGYQVIDQDEGFIIRGISPQEF